MPLSKIIEMECDYCGHCDYFVPPLSSAKAYFLELGYIHCNGRWYCDSKCRDNHKVKMKAHRVAERSTSATSVVAPA